MIQFIVNSKKILASCLQELQGRISSLMDIVASQQTQVEASSSLLQLKTTWGKIIEANLSHKSFKGISTDDTSTALALLSAVFANEVHQHELLQGCSLIHHLLDKITEIESLTRSDVKTYHNENEILRLKVQEKSCKLYESSKLLQASQYENDSNKESMIRLDELSRSESLVVAISCMYLILLIFLPGHPGNHSFVMFELIIRVVII